jgi:uncharacterized protein (TIGR02246 family)
MTSTRSPLPDTLESSPAEEKRPTLDDDILNEPAPENLAGTEETEIGAVIEDWAEGIRRKDVERAASHFDPDAVCFLLAPPLVADRPVRQDLEAWFATFDGPLGYEIRNLTVFTSPDLACAHSLNHLTGKKAAGESVDVWFRVSFFLHRINDRWLIVHCHESVPFLMDGSERAALDLKPA